MSEPSDDPDRTDRGGPGTPRRVVADWEYRTAYIDPFQVRVPPGLHTLLCERARQRQVPLGDLVIEILEEAVRRREGTTG